MKTSILIIIFWVLVLIPSFCDSNEFVLFCAGDGIGVTTTNSQISIPVLFYNSEKRDSTICKILKSNGRFLENEEIFYYNDAKQKITIDQYLNHENRYKLDFPVDDPGERRKRLIFISVLLNQLNKEIKISIIDEMSKNTSFFYIWYKPKWYSNIYLQVSIILGFLFILFLVYKLIIKRIISGYINKQINNQNKQIIEENEQNKARINNYEETNKKQAKLIMQSLFQQVYPVLKKIEYSYFCVAADRIGGDYYCIRKLPDKKHTVFIIADAAGHDLVAALAIYHFSILFHNFINKLVGDISVKKLSELMHKLNNREYNDNVINSNTAIKICCTIVIVKEDSPNLFFVNHGLPFSLFNRKDTVSFINNKNPALGIHPDYFHSDWSTINYEKNDGLLMYSDGLIEAGKDNDYFSSARLKTIYENCYDRTAEDIKNEIFRNLKVFLGQKIFGELTELEDDTSLIILKKK